MMVYSDFSSLSASSIFAVEMGSRPEQGSSRRMISGLSASVRARQRPALLSPGELEGRRAEPVLHLVPEECLLETVLNDVVQVVRSLVPLSLGP
jgi:hypothetical protein